MKAFQLLLCVAVAIGVTACGDWKQSQTAHEPVPAAASPEPGSASGESPAVTASSAAAAAPECKDLEKADPKSCDPHDAAGDPNAK
jgi:hypothetical protein